MKFVWRNNLLTIMDLYSGAGGFSLGFHNTGFKVKLAIDIWNKACQTYKENFPSTEVLNENILDLVPSDFEKVDIIIGGPPCQQFSYLTNYKIPDMRNIVKFFDFVLELKPKVWILENVPGILRFFCLKPYQILNSANYGVPQSRKRVFFGLINKPKITHGSIDYVKLEDVVNIRGKITGGSFPHNNKMNSPNFMSNRLCRTITSHPFFSWEQNRYFTYEENAKLQSFPEDFKFPCAKTNNYILIGNAVPPKLSYAIAKMIKGDNMEG